MEIEKKINGAEVVLTLKGKLDTNTAPELETLLNETLPATKKLEFDFTDLEYLSSAGLRVLLNAQKVMSSQGSMVIKHVNETIMDIFDMTGFSSILNIED